MTTDQNAMLSVIREYCNIADNGNIMAELPWGKSKVMRVGRSLERLGLVTYKPVDVGGYDGGIWELCM